MHPPACSKCKNISLEHTKRNPMFLIGDNISGRKFEEFKKGEYLYSSGNIVDGAYCIYEGRVKISREPKKQKRWIRITHDGDIIGFNSICGCKYYKSAKAISQKVFACYIPFGEIERLNKILSVITHRNKLYKVLREQTAI